MDTTSPLTSSEQRHHRRGHGKGHSKHRKAGKSLRKYLRVLNISLIYYAGYAAFFVYMQRKCVGDAPCFLNTNTNQLLLLLAAFAFLVHISISAIAFVKHRKTRSRRLQAHQAVALVATIVAFMLIIFKGVHVIAEIITGPPA